MPLVISRIGELHFRICRKESRYAELERAKLADGIGGAGIPLLPYRWCPDTNSKRETKCAAGLQT